MLSVCVEEAFRNIQPRKTKLSASPRNKDVDSCPSRREEPSRRRRSVSGIMQSLVLSAFLREYDESKFIREAAASTPGIKGFKLERYRRVEKHFPMINRVSRRENLHSSNYTWILSDLFNFNWQETSKINVYI